MRLWKLGISTEGLLDAAVCKVQLFRKFLVQLFNLQLFLVYNLGVVALELLLNDLLLLSKLGLELLLFFFKVINFLLEHFDMQFQLLFRPDVVAHI